MNAAPTVLVALGAIVGAEVEVSRFESAMVFAGADFGPRELFGADA